MVVFCILYIVHVHALYVLHLQVAIYGETIAVGATHEASCNSAITNTYSWVLALLSLYYILMVLYVFLTGEHQSGHPYSDGWHRPKPRNNAIGAPLQWPMGVTDPAKGKLTPLRGRSLPLTTRATNVAPQLWFSGQYLRRDNCSGRYAGG